MRRILRAAVAAAALATAATACETPEGSSAPDENAAAVMCEEFVKDMLKSPGTADFSGVTDTKTKTLNAKKPYKFSVIGWVDSQNTFGGTVRNDYTCVLSTKDGNEWTLAQDLELEQRD